jgi:hypothetical protein
MRLLLSFVILALWFPSYADVTIQFKPMFGRDTIVPEQYYNIGGGDSIMFETLRFYTGNFTFYNSGAKVYEAKQDYYLVDMNDEQGMNISLPLPTGLSFDSMKFNLGVDSIANTSGALTGPLDPAKGMYWAWQSGYINLKLEGRSNRCPTRNHVFSFHLGGYLPPYASMQEINVPANSHDITIIIPVDQFISAIDLAKQNSIMIPGAEAVALSKTIAGLFQVTPR